MTVGNRRHAKKKPAKQLDREINEVLAKRPGGNGNGGMERVTRERVHEALMGEQVTRTDPVTITLLDAVGPEEWKLVFTKGRKYGGGQGGRILITLGGVRDPLAGLAYAVEHGRPYVHHVWVDPDARGRGLSQVLFDAYRSEVSPDLVVVGPFTKAGRAAAERAGATIEE